MYTIIVSSRNGELRDLRQYVNGTRREAVAVARSISVPGYCTAHVHFGAGPQRQPNFHDLRRDRRVTPRQKGRTSNGTAPWWSRLLPMKPVPVKRPAEEYWFERHYSIGQVVYSPINNLDRFGKPTPAKALREGKLLKKSGRRQTEGYI